MPLLANKGRGVVARPPSHRRGEGYWVELLGGSVHPIFTLLGRAGEQNPGPFFASARVSNLSLRQIYDDLHRVVVRPIRRCLTATTEYGPWGGTNTGHPTMILTGMTHAHYQAALQPPTAYLGEL